MPPPNLSNEMSMPVHLHSAFSTICCGSSPNIVVLKLHTTVVIPNYNLFYTAPIESFEPPYHALADGSLIATPFIADLRGANLLLILLSAAAMFFTMNTFTAVSFLRRGKIKNKSLLYLLLVSQVLGIPAMISLMVTFFDQFANCNTISYIIKISTGVSHTFLMTGILGYKAYRCLNSSRLVLAVLAVLRAIMAGLLVANLVTSDATRRLSGSCFPSGSSGIILPIIIGQTVESAFLCGCFLYAVRKNTKSATYQGRISIQTSSDALKGLKFADVVGALDTDVETSRGWWDYVPEISHAHLETDATQPSISLSHHSVVHFSSSRLPESGYPHSNPGSRSMSRKTSTRTENTPARSIRTPSISFSAGRVNDAARRRDFNVQNGYRPLSGTSSVRSRLSKYISRMQLFKEMLKNELFYTAFLTVIFLLMAILVLVGSRQKWLMTSIGWLCFDWLFVSGFTMHSFSRVVRRHEREALLQHPAAWDPVYRAGLEASRAFRQSQHPRRPVSPISVASRSSRRRTSDPFADFTPDPNFVQPTTLIFDAPTVLPEVPHVARSRQGSNSSTISMSSEGTMSEVSPEVDLAAMPLYNEGQYDRIEDPFASIYETE